jgi:DNA mismatch endonuclease Vsr
MFSDVLGHNRSTEVRLRVAVVRSGIRGWTLHSKEVFGVPDFFFKDCRVAIFRRLLLARVPTMRAHSEDKCRLLGEKDRAKQGEGRERE